MRAINRLFISFGIASVVFFILLFEHVEAFTRIIISWDVFGIMMIIMIWKIFFLHNSQHIRAIAKIEDQSRTITFFIVLAAVIISLMGILILLNNKTKGLVNTNIHAAVSIFGVGISWVLLHTIFATRYAHLYYGETPEDPDQICGGIIFPEESEPDYLDFAYFSFVVGMTFQVSDTNITFKRIRRMVLMHSLISFVYNTIIVAISISVIITLF